MSIVFMMQETDGFFGRTIDSNEQDEMLDLFMNNADDDMYFEC